MRPAALVYVGIKGPLEVIVASKVFIAGTQKPHGPWTMSGPIGIMRAIGNRRIYFPAALARGRSFAFAKSRHSTQPPEMINLVIAWGESYSMVQHSVRLIERRKTRDNNAFSIASKTQFHAS